MRKSFVFLGVILIAGLVFFEYTRFTVSNIEKDIEDSIEERLTFEQLNNRDDTRLNIYVSGQQVTLYGSTELLETSKSIEKAVSMTNGVTSIVNNISVLPTSYPSKPKKVTRSVLKKTIVIDKIVCAHDKCPSTVKDNNSGDKTSK